MNEREIAENLSVVTVTLIALSGVALGIGVYFIKTAQRERHRLAMLTATVLAAIFLVVYVTKAALFQAKVYAGPEEWAWAYAFLLGSHIILAAANGPLALIAIRYAWVGRRVAGNTLEGDAIRQPGAAAWFSSHRKWVRWLVPIWLYVAVTGWLIWVVLHNVGEYRQILPA